MHLLFVNALLEWLKHIAGNLFDRSTIAGNFRKAKFSKTS